MRKGSTEEVIAEIRRDAGGALWTRLMDWALRERNAKITKMLGDEYGGDRLHLLRGEIRILDRLGRVLTELIDEVKRQGGGA